MYRKMIFSIAVGIPGTFHGTGLTSVQTSGGKVAGSAYCLPSSIATPQISAAKSSLSYFA
jgi:hypothetical protein